jgi:hypothetical protein
VSGAPSPYAGVAESKWVTTTQKLVGAFPIEMAVVTECVKDAWTDLFTSRIGSAGLKIGADIFLPAQATGVLLERLITAQLRSRDKRWRGGDRKTEKDVVFDADNQFSFEIKTSSSDKGIFGNRSTGHRSETRTKFRSGYYLVVNYKLPKEEDPAGYIRMVRFGWIDDDDWVGQNSPTGQQASVSSAVAQGKLLTLTKV